MPAPLVPLPPSDAPVWQDLLGLTLLTPVAFVVGYVSMRYGREVQFLQHMLVVDSAEDVSGLGVALQQAGGYLAVVLGVVPLFAVPVRAGLFPPVGVAVVAGVALPAGVLLLARPTLVRPALAPAGRTSAANVVGEYVGLALLAVGLAGLLLTALLVLVVA